MIKISTLGKGQVGWKCNEVGGLLFPYKSASFWDDQQQVFRTEGTWKGNYNVVIIMSDKYMTCAIN